MWRNALDILSVMCKVFTVVVPKIMPRHVTFRFRNCHVAWYHTRTKGITGAMSSLTCEPKVKEWANARLR